jgi:hypothetical protein
LEHPGDDVIADVRAVFRQPRPTCKVETFLARAQAGRVPISGCPILPRSICHVGPRGRPCRLRGPPCADVSVRMGRDVRGKRDVLGS